MYDIIWRGREGENMEIKEYINGLDIKENEKIALINRYCNGNTQKESANSGELSKKEFSQLETDFLKKIKKQTNSFEK